MIAMTNGRLTAMLVFMQNNSKFARQVWAVLAVLMIVSMLFSMVAYGLY